MGDKNSEAVRKVIFLQRAFPVRKKQGKEA